MRVAGNTYLGGSLVLPEGLAGLAVILRQSSDERVRRQQTEWLTPLEQHQIAELALSHEKPQLFWREIIAALTDGVNIQAFKRKVRKAAWLPTRRGESIAPENVILLPEIEDELDRLAAQEQDSYLPPSRLIEEVRRADGYDALQSLFSADEDGLEKLGLLLDGKQEYFLGQFVAELDEEKFQQYLNIMEECPVNLSFPGWRLLQRLGEKHGLALVGKHICPALFQSVDGQRLVAILAWLKAEHESGAKREKGNRLAAYNWTLAAFSQSQNARLLLSELFLLNSESRWCRATELCTNVVGIAGQHILAEEQRNILLDIITEASSAYPRGSGVANNEATTEITLVPNTKAPSFDEWKIICEQLRPTPERLQSFLAPWEGQIASEAICFFLRLLGDHPAPIMRELAANYRGRHSSLDWYREHIPFWEAYNQQKADKYGKNAEEVISKHGFIVEVVPDDQPMQVTAITGGPITVFPEQEVGSFVIGERQLGFWPKLDIRVEWLRLRSADPAKLTPEQFSSALKKTAEYILETVYSQPTNDLDAFWAELNQSEQLDIRVAETLILENIPFYLKQLSVHRRQEELKKVLHDWDDARHRVAEYAQDEKNSKKRDEYAKQQQKYLRDLQTLLRDGGEAQAAVLEAVRAKVKDFQYEPASVPFELFQNADDATAEQAEIEAHHLRPDSSGAELPDYCRRFLVLQDLNRLSFAHWGRPINSTGISNFSGRERGYLQDMEKMLILSSSDKESGKVTGKFGLGFKSVLLICDRPRLVSDRLGFEVVGGMCPVPLTDQEDLRGRLAGVSVDRKRPGTLVDLSLVDAVEPKAVLERFCSLAGGLVIFARQIRSIEIRSDEEKAIRAEWAPEILLEQESCRVELGEFLSPAKHEERLPALYFRCGSGGLLLGFGPRGFQKLPCELPAIWVVAPTKEDTGLGIAVNGEFDLDAGRTKLSGTSEANIQKAKTMGRRLAAGFAAFHDMARQDWPEFIERARLEADLTPYEFWRSFWYVLTDALYGEVSPAKQLIRNVMTGDCGLGDFVNSTDRQVLPTGLWNEHAVLTNPRRVSWVLRGLLADELFFGKAANIKTFAEKVRPKQVISKEIHDTLCRVLPEYGQRGDQWVSLWVQDIVGWAVGNDNRANPETALELGGLISVEDLKKQGGKEIEDETKSLREYLGGLLFHSESGHWVKACELLIRSGSEQGEHGEESLRAGFAPADRRLSRKYGGRAAAFFLLCRKQMKASVEDMESWVWEARGDEERCAALLYLRDGEKKGDLQERLRDRGLQGIWLGELDENSPYFNGWSDEERDELLFRSLLSLDDLRGSLTVPPLPTDEPKPPPLDPSDVLHAIHTWWQREWRTHIPNYERRVYGSLVPDFSMNDDPGRFDRAAWLTLLLLGAFHTMGRTTSHQHRGFIERCNQRGWWQIFSAERPRERSSEWMLVLEEYFDEQVDKSEYEHWFKHFGSIYRFSLYLDDYVEAFCSLDRSREAGDIYQAIQAILFSGAAAANQGGGIDAPPLDKTLGQGICFVLRELKRKNILRHHGVTPYCFVPVGRVRDLFSRLGADVSYGSPLEQSKVIYDFLVEYLGTEKACFDGHYDIPLQIVAEKPDIQELFFHRNLSLNDSDEETSPYLGTDAEETDS